MQNSFPQKNADEFMYYLFYVCEQFYLKPEQFDLFFLGQYFPYSDYYNGTKEFHPNCSHLDPIFPAVMDQPPCTILLKFLSRMRIISGTFKGRRLIAPKQLPVRPTTDRAKEALFNILNHRLDWDEIKTLDLFAGTGNISYELASRGVNNLTAVDQNKHCTYFIHQTAKSFEMPIVVIKTP